MIVVQGVVGAGKSTLAKLLSSQAGIPLIQEPVTHNPYLAKFYKDQKRYVFQLQVYMLHAMFKSALEHRHMRSVMDMSIYGNYVFAQMQNKEGIMSQDDFITYTDLFNTYRKVLDPPELMVYLRCSTDSAMKRIKKRGRDSESDVSYKYWNDLNSEYEDWYEKYLDSKKICIDVTDIDLVSDVSDEDYVVDMIMSYL